MTYPLDRMVEASKRFGLRVEVVPGAESRSAGSFNPFGFVGHHTGGAKTGVRPSLALCVNGRSDLAGPLCNDFLDRDGVDVIVACGRANHAGLGAFRGILGNSGVWGTEAEDDGDGLWTPAQLDAYPRLVAARLWLIGRDASWYCSHRTWALEPPSWPGRKTDPEGISDDWMRARAAPLLAAGSAGAITPLEVPDMPLTTDDADLFINRLVTRARDGDLDPFFDRGNTKAAAYGIARAADVRAAVAPLLDDEGALSALVTDRASGVLAAIAALPTDGMSEDERHALAAEIAAEVPGVTVDAVLDAAGQRLYTPPEPATV